MSDETAVNLVEGRDAAGWYAQWHALKQEIDVLNPTAEALQAKLKIAEAEAAASVALGEQVSALRSQLATSDQELQASRAKRQRLQTEAEQLRAQNQLLRDQISGCFAALAPLHKALGDALAAPAIG